MVSGNLKKYHYDLYTHLNKLRKIFQLYYEVKVRYSKAKGLQDQRF